ncbi:hypothetical protein AK812_SmicGene44422, partial [Symbiodinium microadriaticum]
MLPVPKLRTGFVIILHFLACVARVAPVPGARLVASSCSAQVLKFWPVEPDHHLLRLILDSAQGHLATHSDGGWLFLQLCIRMFHALQDFPPPAALHGLAQVAPVPGARLVASSCSAQVLKFWPVEPDHHLLRLILDSAQGHLATHSDGGWLFLQLCIRMFHALQGTLALCVKAASDVTSALSDAAIRRELDWSNLPSVLALLRGVLCKPLALAKPSDARHICAVTLEAFLYTTPGMEEGRPWQEVVRFEWCCGQDIAWSESHRGLVLDTPGSLVPWGK